MQIPVKTFKYFQFHLIVYTIAFLSAFVFTTSCFYNSNSQSIDSTEDLSVCPHDLDTFYLNLVEAAMNRTKQHVVYDPGYFSIAYPNGDVDPQTGVCTDVIIRIYRQAANIDLQKEVHEDMLANFNLYPTNWGLKKTDTNIDHRRVPNLMKFFERYGSTLPVTDNNDDYKPGDIVTWMLSGNLTHIGIVVCERSSDKERHLIVHNIGAGPKMEDVLFDFNIIGHYRYR